MVRKVFASEFVKGSHFKKKILAWPHGANASLALFLSGISPRFWKVMWGKFQGILLQYPIEVIIMLGYSLMVTAMNLPFGFEDDYNERSESNPDEEGDANSTVSTTTTLAEKIEANNEVITPFIM